MPPRTTFTKEKIIESSIELIRQKGGAAFTIRNVAVFLKASTQPIYRVFANQKELEDEVVAAIKSEIFRRIAIRERDDSNFLTIGLSYIEFSLDEPELLKFVHFSGRDGGELTITNEKKEFIKKMREDRGLAMFSDAVLEGLLTDMFYYTQGLIANILFNNENLSFKKYRNRLHNVGKSLIVAEFVKLENAKLMNKFEEVFR